MPAISKVTQIIHLADIHLRLVKRHDEYRSCFATLKSDIEAVLTDETIIVVAGDIVHAKLDMSPELVQITAEFFTMLADLAPTYVIAGNHDLNLSNMSRMDTLSPIIDMLGHKNLVYWKNSGVFDVGDVSFVVYSILDSKDKWPSITPKMKKKTCIGLYHGPVYGAHANNNFTVTSRHTELSQFDGLDMVLLGDIHTYQVLQEADTSLGKPVVAYCSSLIQQNHGEASSGHGWVLWDVPSRTHTFRELANSYGYVTIDISDGTIPINTAFPDNVRLRIIKGEVDNTTVNKLLATIKKKTQVVEISITKGNADKKAFTKGASVIELDKVSQLTTQTSLLTDWIADHVPTCVDAALKNVVEIHTDLYTRLKLDDKSRNIHWKPISFKFSNMFSYGEDNFITFDDMKGIWGIFAPNASGKSSIMDAMMFCLYDKTPRAYKGDHIMNNRKTTFSCELEFEINGDRFVVSRSAKKNKAGEVKVDVTFVKTDAAGVVTNLNGTERRVTNANIKEYVGSYEDFVLTALSSQSSTSLFVDKTHSERKDLLCQFMGLDIFDQLHFLANEDYKEIGALMKQHKNNQYVDDLVATQDSIDALRAECASIDEEISIVDETLAIQLAKKDEYLSQKIPISVTVTDMTKLESTKESLENAIDKVNEELDILNTTIPVYSVEVIQRDLDALDIKGATDIITLRKSTENAYDQCRLDVSSTQAKIGSLQLQKEQYTKIRFNADCDVCVENNSTVIDQLAKIESGITDEESRLNGAKIRFGKVEFDLEMTKGDYEHALETQKRYTQLVKNLETAKEDENRRALDTQTKIANLVRYEAALEKVCAEIELFNANVKAIELNIELDGHLDHIGQSISSIQASQTTLKNKKMVKYGNLQVLNSKKAELMAAIEQGKELEVKNSAYTTYLAAVGRNGIPHSFLLKALPVIESEVNGILSQVADFTVNLELDGKNVNGFIQYSDDRTWPLENGSGMERFISGLAIRVSLMNATSLPKPNFIMIDEGFSALDVDNLHNMVVFLDLLKSQFDTVLLISHLETVRDMAEEILEISRDNGYSSIRH